MVLDDATLARAKEEYDRQGFTLVKGFLRGEALATTQREAAAYLTEIAPAKPESEAFYIEQGDVDTIVQTHEMYETDFWLQLPWSDDWLQLARACGGTDALGPKSVGLSKDGKRFCKSLELHQKGPGGKSVRSPPHQDNWCAPPHPLKPALLANPPLLLLQVLQLGRGRGADDLGGHGARRRRERLPALRARHAHPTPPHARALGAAGVLANGRVVDGGGRGRRHPCREPPAPPPLPRCGVCRG